MIDPPKRHRGPRLRDRLRVRRDPGLAGVRCSRRSMAVRRTRLECDGRGAAGWTIAAGRLVRGLARAAALAAHARGDGAGRGGRGLTGSPPCARRTITSTAGRARPGETRRGCAWVAHHRPSDDAGARDVRGAYTRAARQGRDVRHVRAAHALVADVRRAHRNDEAGPKPAPKREGRSRSGGEAREIGPPSRAQTPSRTTTRGRLPVPSMPHFSVAARAGSARTSPMGARRAWFPARATWPPS